MHSEVSDTATMYNSIYIEITLIRSQLQYIVSSCTNLMTRLQELEDKIIDQYKIHK